MAGVNRFGALSAGGGSNVQIVGEDDPLDVSTDTVGMPPLSGGDDHVQLLPEGFAEDALPPPSASLFSIASKRGLFAAAGPKSFVFGTTASLRQAFFSKGNYTPQLSVELSTPASHAAFNADESYVILAASSGGLAVYAVDDLASGTASPKPTFEIDTNRISLREVKPNPTNPDLVSILDSNGNARMLNISKRELSPTLKEGVATTTWSQKGAQIVCGLADGTGWQMTPQGEQKAVLPAPPGLENHFISAILWLENNVFITAHAPAPGTSEEKDSRFYELSRSGQSYTYRRLPEPVGPWGLDRSPPYYFSIHLKGYAPALRDMILLASTCGTEVGVIARFSEDCDNGQIKADEFIVASIFNETRRAAMPLAPDSSETSPIGMAVDLSSQENVRRPLGSDEVEESNGPLPICMALNHKGKLAAWNVVYDDAMRRGEKYAGMAIDGPEIAPASSILTTPAQPGARSTTDQRAAAASASPFASTTTPTASPFAQKPAFGSSTPAFGKPSFGQPSFGQPAKPAFGQPAAFGQSSFGQPSPLGNNAFGASTSGTGTAFGQASTLGAASKPSFGQSTQLGASSASPFAATPASGSPFAAVAAAGGSGFGAYATKGGFDSLASNAPQGGNVFGSGSPIATKDKESVFGSGSAGSQGVFGSGSGFQLSSGFKADPSQAEDKKAATPAGSLGSFGLNLGSTLSNTPSANVPQSKEADMDTDTDKDDDDDDDNDTDQEIISPAAARNIRPEAAPSTSPFATSKASPFATAGETKPSPFASSPFASAKSTDDKKASPFGSGGSFGSAKPAGDNPFANMKSSPSPFGAPAQAKNPFASSSTSNPFASKTSSPFGAPAAGGVNPFANPATSTPSKPSSAPTQERSTPPDAPLPPDFADPKVKTEPPSSDEEALKSVPKTPLPPDAVSKDPYAPGSTSSGGTPAGNSPESSIGGEDAPLPPDFTTPKKTPNSEPPPALPQDDDEDDGLGEDEEADDEGDEEDEEEPDEEDEDEEEDEEEEDEDEENKSPPKEAKSLASMFGSGQPAKTPAPTSGGTSSIFGSTTSYKSEFGSNKFQSTSPFSSLAKKATEGPEEDDDEDEEEETEGDENKAPAPRSSASKKASAGRALSNRMNIGAGHKTAPKASSSVFLNTSKTGSSSSLFGTGAAPSSSQQSAAPTSAPVKQESSEAPAQQEEPEEEVESDVEEDREYADVQDEKIREQLLKFPPKPVATLPEISKTKEVDVADDFDNVFDSIYQSGNMMVNKLGQTARGLAGFYLAQREPLEDVKHVRPEDMEHAADWRFCEINVAAQAADTLLSDVRDLERDKLELEQKQKIATGQFIKLNTKETELARQLAVYNEPGAAAAARARLLAPEQQLQQAALRKAFLRVDKSLRETEHAATLLKAKIAQRDRHRASARTLPPTAEAVRNTILKLTDMIEHKNADVDYLAQKLRRLKAGDRRSSSRSLSATPGRYGTPQREVSATPERTPMRTPMRGAGGLGNAAATPLLAIVEQQDVEEMRETQRRRREAGRRLRGVLEVRGVNP